MAQNKNTQPIMLPDTAAPKEGETVYSLDIGKYPIVKANIWAQRESETWVKSEKGSQLKHRTDVFTPSEVGQIALDMLPASEDGADRYLPTVIDEMIAEPENQDELFMRLKAASSHRFNTEPKSERDFGVRSVKELTGTGDEHGSNLWKVQSLVRGIKSGKYGKKVNNTLHFSHITKDAKVLPEDKKEELEQKVYRLDREAAEKIYEMYGVDFEDSTVYESTTAKAIIRKTIHASPDGFYFEEVTGYWKDDEKNSTPYTFYVNIVVGDAEEWHEKGFLPTT